MPLGVVTRTSTVPLPAGAVAVTWVSLTTVTFVAALLPKDTPVAPVRCTPVIVTVLPPASWPGRGSEPGHGWLGQNLLQRIMPGVDDKDIVVGIDRHAHGPA